VQPVFLSISAASHTVYVSVTSIYFSENNLLPNVKIRLFYDDLQRCTKVDWGLATNPSLIDFAEGGIDRYINDHLKIKMDQISLQLQLAQIEEDGEALSIEMNTVLTDSTTLEMISNWEKMEVYNSIFTDHIDAQQNLIRFRYESDRFFENLDRSRLKTSFKRPR
jgi:hypothetical protein